MVKSLVIKMLSSVHKYPTNMNMKIYNMLVECPTHSDTYFGLSNLWWCLIHVSYSICHSHVVTMQLIPLIIYTFFNTLILRKFNTIGKYMIFSELQRNSGEERTLILAFLGPHFTNKASWLIYIYNKKWFEVRKKTCKNVENLREWRVIIKW